MYCKFFGFSRLPFNLTPDPDFLFMADSHREALASILYGIRERKGFIVITGEAGTGKTTLLNAVMERLDGDTKFAYTYHPEGTFPEVLQIALIELGLAKPDEQLSHVEGLFRLNQFAIEQLAEGKTVALIMDEAQRLDWASLEKVRMLSNLETRKSKLIQIVLSGQPPLDIALQRPELRQLSQRINIRRVLSPLGEKDTISYISHRLSVATYRGPPPFDKKAMKLIWRYSEGTPRRINVICDNSLLTAFSLGRRVIGPQIIQEVIDDLGWTTGEEHTRETDGRDKKESLPRGEESPMRLTLMGRVQRLNRRALSLKKGLRSVAERYRKEGMVSELPEERPSSEVLPRQVGELPELTILSQMSEVGREVELPEESRSLRVLPRQTDELCKLTILSQTSEVGREVELPEESRSLRVLPRQTDELCKLTILSQMSEVGREVELPEVSRGLRVLPRQADELCKLTIFSQLLEDNLKIRGWRDENE